MDADSSRLLNILQPGGGLPQASVILPSSPARTPEVIYPVTNHLGSTMALVRAAEAVVLAAAVADAAIPCGPDAGGHAHCAGGAGIDPQSYPPIIIPNDGVTLGLPPVRRRQAP